MSKYKGTDQCLLKLYKLTLGETDGLYVCKV